MRYISIHALREEGDVQHGQDFADVVISIHALREEGDLLMRFTRPKCDIFLSTPSARRATFFASTLFPEGVVFLSTPSARRATRFLGKRAAKFLYFYPRPPRGGRRKSPGEATRRQNFYPRPPRGGRPGRHAEGHQQDRISIHALREEGDFCNAWSHGVAIGISIHALREEGDP